jgi:hypothetical protein
MFDWQGAEIFEESPVLVAGNAGVADLFGVHAAQICKRLTLEKIISGFPGIFEIQ